MIPNVLKVNYSKTIKLLDKNDLKLKQLFNEKEIINYDELQKNDLLTIKKALEEKKV